MLKINYITKQFGGVKAVTDLSFNVKKGSITGLIGPNGAGKTTAFNLITGFIRKDSGYIEFQNKKWNKFSPDTIAKAGMTRTFQQIKNFENLTVRDNLVLAASSKYDNWWQSFTKINETKAEQESRAILKEIGLEKFWNEPAKDLSYGQSKLLEIAQKVLSGAKILMLDEPASGINPTRLNEVSNWLKKLNKQGLTILVIEHNIPFLMDLCDEVVVMAQGKFLAQDTPEKIQKNPAVLAAYLGN